MKWEGYNDKASEKATKAITRVFGYRALYTLVTLAAVGMVLVASSKWGG